MTPFLNNCFTFDVKNLSNSILAVRIKTKVIMLQKEVDINTEMESQEIRTERKDIFKENTETQMTQKEKMTIRKMEFHTMTYDL